MDDREITDIAVATGTKNMASSIGMGACVGAVVWFFTASLWAGVITGCASGLFLICLGLYLLSLKTAMVTVEKLADQ